MFPDRRDGDCRVAAYFVSPHGYGHAARAAAVMEAVYATDAAVRFDVFTQVPRWFFETSLTAPFAFHSCETDVGLVQTSPLQEDLEETIRRLDKFLPFEPALIDGLARQLEALGCEVVLCDIAPMGILVARRLGIPSVLVENFTWDWIYEGYSVADTRMNRHADYLRSVFGKASHRIQTEPVCLVRPADLVTAPVSRKFRTPPKEVRARLGVSDNEKAVLVTMGGIAHRYDFLQGLFRVADVRFIVPGGSNEPKMEENLILLPNHCEFYHPDLVNASDAVVGKVGYSTLAEVYRAGVPFGYVTRPRFRESQCLAAYIEREIPSSIAITPEGFASGAWISFVSALVSRPRLSRSRANGAEQVAEFIRKLFRGAGSAPKVKL